MAAVGGGLHGARREQFAVAASLAPDQEQFKQSLQGVRHAISEQGGAADKGEL